MVQGQLRHAAVLCTAACLCASALTGCSFLSRDSEASGSVYHVYTESAVSDLTDGAFYVRNADGTYDRLYIGESSFQPGSGGSSDPSRVLWFGRDFDCIPTMHKGEDLVYHSSANLPETLSLERFDDIGYTVGICGLTPSSTSGRYMFSTDPGDLNIDVKSDADRLCRLGDQTALIDAIGHTSLRSGNISRGGTIVGLQEGKTYRTNVYIGTEIYPYDLVADVRAMLSMEDGSIDHYSLTESSLAVYSFPETYESGYYLVNGYGLVRYLKSETGDWNESMDMAVPNADIDAESEAESVSSDSGSTPANDSASVPFTLDEGGSITVRVDYGVSGRSYLSGPGRKLAAPTARLVGTSGVYTLNDDGNDVLSMTADLAAGQYTLQINGLGGRAYAYRVIRNVREGKKQDVAVSETSSDAASSESASSGKESSTADASSAASTELDGASEGASSSLAGSEGGGTDSGSSSLTMAERLQKMQKESGK